MARSPAHELGEDIGLILEEAIEPLLEGFAKRQHLYLDRRGPRPARSGERVLWTDRLGNQHALDFVLERGGTDAEIGEPVAFIESAYRRYTKHSRNKAQELQGALQPLSETHRHTCPFLGAFLAGVFTDGAIQQLRSHGFVIAYLPYEEVVYEAG